MKTEETKKQLKNLFEKLTKDSNSFLLGVKNKQEPVRVFTNFIMKLKIVILFLMKKTKKYLFCAPFIEQKKGIDQSSTLYSIKTSFEFFHADIANIKFLSKSAFDPHYYLLCVDLL